MKIYETIIFTSVEGNRIALDLDQIKSVHELSEDLVLIKSDQVDVECQMAFNDVLSVMKQIEDKRSRANWFFKNKDQEDADAAI